MTDQSPPPGWGGQDPPGWGGQQSPGWGGQQPPSYPGGQPGYGPPQQGYGPGYGGYPGPQNQQSSTPTVLSIIGIVCLLFCSPAAIVLGLIAQSQFRNQGRSDTLAKVAWIGGIALLILGIVIAISVHH